MNEMPATGTTAPRTGLEDVMRSVRALAKQSRLLVESAAGVAERELAMALSAAEELRDSVVSREALEKARDMELMSRLRSDAHRAVDLGVDALAATYVFGVQVVERFIDQPRTAIADKTQAS